MIRLREHNERAKDLNKDLLNKMKDQMMASSNAHLANQKVIEEIRERLSKKSMELESLKGKNDSSFSYSKHIQQEITRIKLAEEELKTKKESLEKKKKELEAAQEKRKEKEEKRGNISEIQEAFSDSFKMVKELNEVYFKEYAQIRILQEQIHRAKKGSRVFCCLFPRDLQNKNAFDYEVYMRLSKNQKVLGLNQNRKVMENFKNAQESENQRENKPKMSESPSAEENQEDLLEELNEPFEMVLKCSNLASQSSSQWNPMLIEGDSEDKINSEVERSLSPSRFLLKNPFETPKTEENRLINALTPDPVSLLNSLIQNSSGFPQNQIIPSHSRDLRSILPNKAEFTSSIPLSPHGPDQKIDLTCKFDAVLNTGYLVSFFGFPVTRKLFFEVELFIKTGLYKNPNELLKAIPYSSEQWMKLLCLSSKNCHYNLGKLQEAFQDQRGTEANPTGNPLDGFSPDIRRLLLEIFQKGGVSANTRQNVVDFPMTK